MQYSWHQSHDQATVLILVPYQAQEDDVHVIIDRSHLLAGLRGQPPVLKGRLYASVDTTKSMWQLEPQPSRFSRRERTTSTTSTASTPSSYAFISDPEISSSFAASLESGQVSEIDDMTLLSPAHSSSPLSTPADEQSEFPSRLYRRSRTSSRAVSPGDIPRDMMSSYSSLESLQSTYSGRLLTIHLEKAQSIIWPSLIVGPIGEAISPPVPIPLLYDSGTEHKYNMDPTSLALIALELYDIRKDRNEAFQFFIRAWHQARLPSTTMRLVTHYIPLQTSFDWCQKRSSVHETTAYFIQCLGGTEGMAQLYREAGLLHLEGSASVLLSSSSSTLSSIRVPTQPLSRERGSDSWRRDREAARKYFERARTLRPNLDVPILPPDSENLVDHQELEMPSLDIHHSVADSVSERESQETLTHRRQQKEELQILDPTQVDAMDNSWHLYIPGLVGAGTALVVVGLVGVVGALSFSTWRKNQTS